MAKLRDWSAGSKVLTFSLACLLVSFGLCGVGSGFEGHGTPLQGAATAFGFFLFLASAVGILVGIIMAIVSARRKSS